ncbi:hypothetical protein KSP40_PGU015555 [Platanthera guangdongensis]|uniref:Uncharacterized protein n=1 Tax=Platanthera guangdongensis TaxID=2320717 RepID=A0ABR2LSE0_9ASPA
MTRTSFGSLRRHQFLPLRGPHVELLPQLSSSSLAPQFHGRSSSLKAELGMYTSMEPRHRGWPGIGNLAPTPSDSRQTPPGFTEQLFPILGLTSPRQRNVPHGEYQMVDEFHSKATYMLDGYRLSSRSKPLIPPNYSPASATDLRRLQCRPPSPPAPTSSSNADAYLVTFPVAYAIWRSESSSPSPATLGTCRSSCSKVRIENDQSKVRIEKNQRTVSTSRGTSTSRWEWAGLVCPRGTDTIAVHALLFAIEAIPRELKHQTATKENDGTAPARTISGARPVFVHTGSHDRPLGGTTNQWCTTTSPPPYHGKMIRGWTTRRVGRTSPPPQLALKAQKIGIYSMTPPSNNRKFKINDRLIARVLGSTIVSTPNIYMFCLISMAWMKPRDCMVEIIKGFSEFVKEGFNMLGRHKTVEAGSRYEHWNGDVVVEAGSGQERAQEEGKAEVLVA